MTSPQYFLISRQVMVDIPFVVIQSIAIGFLALGMLTMILVAAFSLGPAPV